ncbi:class I SAM-dependent methyltransferase [Patescibacteria group bacterium]|nr:class I SAM-dependent methyltransferase [Patescibacteria group bacterium]
MGSKAALEKFYSEIPLERIPWYNEQDDFFKELLDVNKLGEGSALDLGCGVGTKSIALAKKGFIVTGIDISPTAVRYARERAEKANVHIKFIAADATDLACLGDEEFDLILDWTTLHVIARSRRRRYVRGIIKHCKRGGLLLLRCFSKYRISKLELGFIAPTGLVYLFSREDIENLFGKHFKILLTNRSERKSKDPERWFDEYLMERK